MQTSTIALISRVVFRAADIHVLYPTTKSLLEEVSRRLSAKMQCKNSAFRSCTCLHQPSKTSKAEPGSTLYVGRLPSHITGHDMEEAFTSFGEVK